MITLSESTAQMIRGRQPFTVDPHMIGYKTKGGTYVLATNGKQSDSGKPNDLLAVTRYGQVVPLGISTNPELIAAVEAVLA